MILLFHIYMSHDCKQISISPLHNRTVYVMSGFLWMIKFSFINFHVE